MTATEDKIYPGPMGKRILPTNEMGNNNILDLVVVCYKLVEWAWSDEGSWIGYENMKSELLDKFGEIRQALIPLLEPPPEKEVQLVYMVERGQYEDRYVASIHTTVIGAMAHYKDEDWEQVDDHCWENSQNGDDRIVITGEKVL